MRSQGRSKGEWTLLPLASSAGLQVGSSALPLPDPLHIATAPGAMLTSGGDPLMCPLPL